jgi:ABC-type multidrug transport system permease subunit
MRWLLIKDLQILRRSPFLVGLLVVYPIAIALMIGLALSSPPGKPTVAFYNQVAPGHGRLGLGRQQVDVAQYASGLLASVHPLRVDSRAAAVADVRSGRALAAVIIPGDLPQQLQSLISTGIGSPTVEVILNSNDPVERQFVQQAISSRLAEVEQAVSKQVLRVAISDLQQVLSGGQLRFLGQSVRLLGLRSARTIVAGTIAALPARSPLRLALRQVVSFANLAISGLAFAGPALNTIGNPLTVEQTQLAGRTTPTDTYAAAIAVIVSLMFVTVLLAAGLLALERSENTYARLTRGLVSPARLLAEKAVLAGGCASAVTLIMAALVSIFVPLDWGRFELWLLALLAGAAAFGALGVLIGALAREVSAASLLALLVSLPLAFVALVPANAVSGAVKTVLDAVAFVFPFRPALEALSNAVSGTSPGLALPVVHLVALAAVFWGLARVALRRFAD